MFGTVAKDQYVSNASVKSNTTAGILDTSSIIQDPSTGYPGNPPVGPYSVITIPKFDNSKDPVIYKLTVDSSNLTLGDIVVVLFSNTTPAGETVTVTLPTNIYTSFNNTPGNPELTLTPYSQFAFTLLFNGSIFVNTFEFC